VLCLSYLNWAGFEFREVRSKEAPKNDVASGSKDHGRFCHFVRQAYSLAYYFFASQVAVA
jgi:hypothetical protein